MSLEAVRVRMAALDGTRGARRAASASAPARERPADFPATLRAALGPTGSGWQDRLPPAGRPWAGAIETAATQAGVDPALLASLTWSESGFRSDARSGAGAVGLTQLMPGTAAQLGVNPYDPAQNLEGGARYLATQLDRFGSVDLALAAYNAGPGAVAHHGGIPPIAETQAYVQRVLARWADLSAPTPPLQGAR